MTDHATYRSYPVTVTRWSWPTTSGRRNTGSGRCRGMSEETEELTSHLIGVIDDAIDLPMSAQDTYDVLRDIAANLAGKIEALKSETVTPEEEDD